MKRFIKLALATSVALGLAVSIKKKQAYDRGQLHHSLLSQAKSILNLSEPITGSWLDTMPVWSNTYQEEVFIGGVMTTSHQYDFIGSSVTGNILVLEQTK